MPILASLLVPRRFTGPHLFKSIANIHSSKSSYYSYPTYTTVYKSTYDMNSVRNHTLATSSSVILRTPAFYLGVAIATLMVAFFLFVPLFVVFLYLGVDNPNSPVPKSVAGGACLRAILFGVLCGLPIELFGFRMGVSFALSSMKEALVRRERGRNTHWRIEDADRWDKFVASLKRV